ncbi:MAG: peptidyl-prolyl cis-trans isomerase [Planctomycetes bacterium]|nr:peptidyl-prolyl cis-trans isomerase [Planctomycetota bacterium]
MVPVKSQTTETEKPAAVQEQAIVAPKVETTALPQPVVETAKPAAAAVQVNPIVVLKTLRGEIDIELYPDKAPITVANFLQYVKSGHYNGTIFHRVIPGFMIQGGGMTADMTLKATNAAIKNEATNGLKNERGTIAMARMSSPDSAMCQFFINVNNNVPLNYAGPGRGGYAVFGRVVKGMEVADAIVSVPTHTVGIHEAVPVTPVVIESAAVK